MHRVNLRLKDEEYKLLVEKAEEAGFSPTNYAKYLTLLGLDPVREETEQLGKLISDIPKRIKSLTSPSFIVSALYGEEMWPTFTKDTKLVLARALSRYVNAHKDEVCFHKTLSGNITCYKKLPKERTLILSNSLSNIKEYIDTYRNKDIETIIIDTTSLYNDYSTATINPMDLFIGHIDNDWILSQQFDYLIELFESVLDKPLTAMAKSKLDKIIFDIYKPYVDYINNSEIHIDYSSVPQLKDFCNALVNTEDDGIEGLKIALKPLYENILYNGVTKVDSPYILEAKTKTDFIIQLNFAFILAKQNYYAKKKTCIVVTDMNEKTSCYLFEMIYKRLRTLGCSAIIGCSDIDMIKTSPCRSIVANSSGVVLSCINDCQCEQICDMFGADSNIIDKVKTNKFVLL